MNPSASNTETRAAGLLNPSESRARGSSSERFSERRVAAVPAMSSLEHFIARAEKSGRFFHFT
jgi:hypothetical protein